MLKLTVEISRGSITRHYDEFNSDIEWYDEIEDMKEKIYQSTKHNF